MVMRAMRWVGWALLFAVAFVVNPAWVAGCVSDEDDIDYAAVERELLDDLDTFSGTASWEFTEDGEKYEILLALSQRKGDDHRSAAPARPAFMPVAYACGDVTFFQSASACAPRYELALEGTMTLRRIGADEATIVSDVEVSGTLISYGGVELSLGGENYVSFEGNGKEFWLSNFEVTNLGDEKLDLSWHN